MRSLFLTLFLAVCFNATAQLDAYQEDIITLLEINGTQEIHAADYESVMTVLRKNFETMDVPEPVWKGLKADRPKSMAELTRMLSFVYRKHFTHEEIKALFEFYTTDAAQKWIERNKGELSETETKEVKAFIKSKLGKKETSKLDAIKADSDAVVRRWKIELTGQKMSALIKQGYRTRF